MLQATSLFLIINTELGMESIERLKCNRLRIRSMNFYSLLVIAIALAMDATAVSIGVGTAMQNWQLRSMSRLSFHFGIFQFLMPILGWLVGSSVSSILQHFDHWIAFGLLSIVAGHMVYEAIHEDNVNTTDSTSGMRMIVLSIATSIDAFAIGITFVALNIPILFPCIVIGLVCMVLSFAGGLIGYKTKKLVGKAAQLLGALILFLVGLRIIITHIAQNI